MTLRRTTTRAEKYYCMIIEIRSKLLVFVCAPCLCVRPTCYFCDVKRRYWNYWSETLGIVAPVELLLAVAVAAVVGLLRRRRLVGHNIAL